MRKPTILILGIERSGSTWLLNILDSVPSTVTYMEPFADYAGLFPGFPHRFQYLKEVDIDQKVWVEKKFDELYSKKYGFFYNPGNSLAVKKIEKSYIRIIKKISNTLEFGPSKKIEQFELLNLTDLDFKKVNGNQQAQVIIKELRLNFKIGLIKALFPFSKVVIAIRNPVLQIESILKNFQKNNLHELKRSLLFFHSLVSANQRFEGYSSLMSRYPKFDIIEQLAMYWLISYNTLVEDLGDFNLPYIIANNDILSLHPDGEINRILGFCEIDIGEQTRDYIQRSTSLDSSGAKSIDTNRNSTEYYNLRVQQVEHELKNRILSVINEGQLSAGLITTLEFKK